jgi:S-formylglutathione hydrolase FrmB
MGVTFDGPGPSLGSLSPTPAAASTPPATPTPQAPKAQQPQVGLPAWLNGGSTFEPSVVTAPGKQPLPPVGDGNVHVYHIMDPATGKPRTVCIWLPNGVANTANLPVLYMLHGSPGSAYDLFKGKGVVDQLNKAYQKTGKAFMIVTPDGNPSGDGPDKNRRDTQWANSTDPKIQLETFLTTTLIKDVEGNQRRDRSNRILAGFSMGGFGAANVGMHNPTLYGKVAVLQGYFTPDDPGGVFSSSSANPAGPESGPLMADPANYAQGGDPHENYTNALASPKVLAANNPSLALGMVGSGPSQVKMLFIDTPTPKDTVASGALAFTKALATYQSALKIPPGSSGYQRVVDNGPASHSWGWCINQLLPQEMGGGATGNLFDYIFPPPSGPSKP